MFVFDGRGEAASYLAGRWSNGEFQVLATQPLPHSLGYLYTDTTVHLGFRPTSDEYKVMGLAAYGRRRFLDQLRQAVFATTDGGFVTGPLSLESLAARRPPGQPWGQGHADLASSVQIRLEEVVLDLARWLYGQTGDRVLTMAGGVALNCVANSRLSDWYQGRSEYGPRALGQRSLLANPGLAELERLNEIKGREQFRPLAPMVLADRAARIFDGPLPSPYMLFTRRVRDGWRERILAVTHVDGSARIQTVDGGGQPLLALQPQDVEDGLEDGKAQRLGLFGLIGDDKAKVAKGLRGEARQRDGQGVGAAAGGDEDIDGGHGSLPRSRMGPSRG